MTTIDFSKPYCGNCGDQGSVRLLRYTPNGERLSICRDMKLCHVRFMAMLSQFRQAQKARR